MADAIHVAQQRRENYKRAISEKEQEIEELKELMADLDNFIEFGQALLSDDGHKPNAVSQDAAPKPVQEAPKVVKPADPQNEWDDDAAIPPTHETPFTSILQRRSNGFRMAHIGLNNVDPPGRTRQTHIARQMRSAHSDPHTIASIYELSCCITPDETGAAKQCDQTFCHVEDPQKRMDSFAICAL